MTSDDAGPRKRRRTFDIAGHAHEFTFSCYHLLPLLSKDRPRLWLIESLEAARRTLGLKIWAYVIMPEHAHVLTGPPPDGVLVEHVLKSIKQPVARRATNYLRNESPTFLAKLRVIRPDGRIEHRFWQQGGGYDRNVFSKPVVWASADYLHDNPVRRGLVRSATDWRWSSACFYAGLPDVVLIPDPMDLG